MNRREFTKLSGASLAAAALPLPSLGAAASHGTARAGYIWAVATAKAQGAVSSDMLVRQLGVSPRAARALHARLIARGVVRAPNAAGLSRAVAPLFQGGIPAPAAAQAASAARPPAPSGLGDKARKIHGALSETSQTDPGTIPAPKPEIEPNAAPPYDEEKPEGTHHEDLPHNP